MVHSATDHPTGPRDNHFSKRSAPMVGATSEDLDRTYTVVVDNPPSGKLT